MPELAEVEFMRRRWDAGLGEVVVGVGLHARARVFRGRDTGALRRALAGEPLVWSGRAGKRMLFRFGEAGWLTVHLGMTGELLVEPPGHVADRHDHLVLRQSERALVFRDPRMFGAVEAEVTADAPTWWRERPPEILDAGFSEEAVADFLRSHARAPLKPVLLMQEGFPGVGNWMADEILWRAGLHPARPAGTLERRETVRLHRAARFVCRGALRLIVRGGADGGWGDPPRGWLFHRRWEDGGRCPRTGAALVRETIGGRTTCWSPVLQRR
jgi:formamidopyrimidine-DNA glycosylase